MKKILFGLAFLAAGGFLTPTAAQADVRKEQVYILGVHLGNADAVLFGLTNSYDQRKSAHPNGVPLIQRQLRWSIDLAKELGFTTADMETLNRDLVRLEFSQMRTRLQPILARYRGLVASSYTAKATAIFDLGRQLTMAQGYARHGLNVRPKESPRWRPPITTSGGTMTNNITTNKLEATVSLAIDITKRSQRGDAYNSLITFMDDVLKRWQKDFGKAPAFNGSAGGPGGGVAGRVVFDRTGQLTAGSGMDRVRRNAYANVFNVQMNAGSTYQIDVMSGNGRYTTPPTPGFFDVYLRIEDASGRQIVFNDDGGEGYNSRVTWRPQQSGTYRVIVTSFRSRATGTYRLQVRQ